jgi:hypothetical protein
MHEEECGETPWEDLKSRGGLEGHIGKIGNGRKVIWQHNNGFGSLAKLASRCAIYYLLYHPTPANGS